jgi:hypothetical protein
MHQISSKLSIFSSVFWPNSHRWWWARSIYGFHIVDAELDPWPSCS